MSFIDNLYFNNTALQNGGALNIFYSTESIKLENLKFYQN